MSDTGKDTLLENDDAVEALLGKAAPRLVPPEAETEAVRLAVHAEWQQVTGQRRKRNRVRQWALAASITIAALVTLNMLGTGRIEPLQVATIDKQFGAVTVLGENSQLLEQSDVAGVDTGQTIRTRANSGIGLSWAGGGSLRVDANSRVEFVSGTEVYLHEGRVYFDSEPALAAATVTAAAVQFTILSDFGEVAHVGTQYMAQTDGATLVVSVREGQVEIRTERGESATAARNQQLAVSGGGVHGTVNILPHGGHWQWVERISPAASLDGRSIDEFLGWVSHETGLELEYASDDAESYASQEELNGRLERGPREALNFWMPGTDLEWRIDDGVIYVSKAR